MVLTTKALRAGVALGLLAGSASGLAAQRCPSGRIVPDLGIAEFDCLACTLHGVTPAFPDGWIEFGAEPTLRQIRPGGPADGKIVDGDVLVAVEGMPITVEAAGQRFAAPPIGRPLRVTVRRAGRELTVTVVPAAHCAAAQEREDAPKETPRPPGRPSDGVAHRGWLGIGISCWCISQDQPDGTVVWSFHQLPEVVAIDAAGPARATGLRPGDLIRGIDGVVLTTPEGGRRFGAVRPGDRVRITYERDGVEHTVTVIAARRNRSR